MTIANCARCSRMYQKATTNRKICMSCIQEEESAFRLVHDHLHSNPGDDLRSVCEATGVDESVILRFLKEGRLGKLGDLAGGLAIECARCGKPVNTGRYCVACNTEMEEALKNSSAQALADKPKPHVGLPRPRKFQ